MINRVFIQTFGEFDVFVDGRKIAFRHPKSKEVLAVLVDKRGLSMSRPEIFSVIWEDRFYDRAMQSQFDTLIRSMRRTLKGYGIDCIFEIKKGFLRIRPQYAECDYWQFITGDAKAIQAFGNEYMNGYAWADTKRECLEEKKARWTVKQVSTEQNTAGPEHVRPILNISPYPAVEARTFGGFDVMVNGEFVAFGRAKSKELLAYLIESRGKPVGRKEAARVLWEERSFDRACQKQLDVVIRSLTSTLCEYGISDIVEVNKEMRVVPSRFVCDVYRYLNGEADAVFAYCGEYMNAYSWASATEACLNGMHERVQVQSL